VWKNGRLPRSFARPDELLRSERVRLDRFVERRIEVDDADAFTSASRLPRSSARSSSERPRAAGLTSPSSGVTFDRRKSSNASPCFRRTGANGGRGRDLRPEPLVARHPLLAADQQPDVAHVRVVVHEHREPDLPEEPGAADDEEALALEGRSDVERFRHAFLHGPHRRDAGTRSAAQTACGTQT
jgi:hypothetical protein